MRTPQQLLDFLSHGGDAETDCPLCGHVFDSHNLGCPVEEAMALVDTWQRAQQELDALLRARGDAMCAEVLRLLPLGEVLITAVNAREQILAPELEGEVITLKFSTRYLMADRTCDLRVGDDAISQTLSFGGRDQMCRIPWHLVVDVRLQPRPGGLALVKE